ncbi:MAG: hypothetical protein K6E85_17690 [Lachnospiraceae bacterium]|nr:hypothetical protein [Lachnospiraceae bacterium]
MTEKSSFNSLINDEIKTVEIKTVEFRCKRKVDWNSVESYLKRYIGNQYIVEETGDIIYISSDFPDEYSHSEYSSKIYGTLAKAKANASQAIPELIKNARYISFQSNLKEKHNRDASNGWYRFMIRFTLPIFDDKGNIIGNNCFRGRMVVRCDGDNKKYLYDIVDINKET